MHRLCNCKFTILILILFGWVWTLPADAAPRSAGVVIAATGKVVAVDTDQNERALKRRSKLYEGETIATDATGKAQLRFVDGAIISLRSSSALRIDNYVFEDQNQKDSSVLTLLKGGFRTITGAIGKENYKVNSSLATIGIRGTVYTAAFGGKSLYVATWEGGVSVENEGGRIDLGADNNYRYAQVNSRRSAPKGLSEPPKAVVEPAATPGKTSQQQQDEGNEDDTQDDDSQESDSDNTSEDSSETDDTGDSGETTDSSTTDTSEDSTESTDTSSTTDDSTSETDLTTDDGSSDLTTEDSTTDLTTTEGSTSPTQETDTGGETTAVATNSTSLTDYNFSENRIGLVVYTGANQPEFSGGKASDDLDGTQVVTDNTLDPNQTGFYTDDPVLAFYKGEASASVAGSVDLGTDGNGTQYIVTWGVWNTTNGAAIRQTDPTTNPVNNDINTDVFWATIQQTQTMPTSGSGTYSISSTEGYIMGGGSGGQIDAANAYFSASVDFATGDITGAMNIYTNDTWNVYFSGNSSIGMGVQGALFDVDIDPGSTVDVGNSGSDIVDVSGDIPAVFTGPNAEAVGGGFDLEGYNNSTNTARGDVHAEGIFMAVDPNR